MNASKTLTIAMPCYNVEQYLSRGLDSLADARFENDLEVLVVNDGSTDSTKSIAQEYADRLPKIFKIVNKENGGHGSAVNAGIKNASGRYFRVIDGDDWVNTEGLAKVLQVLRDLDSDIVIDEMSTVEMASMQATRQLLPSYVKESQLLSFEETCNAAGLESYIDIHTLTFKTSLLQDNDITLREGIFYVDYEYVVKGTCFAKTEVFLRENVYQYLVGNSAQSMAAPNMVKRYLHHETVLKELLAFEAANQDLPEETKSYLKQKIRLLIHTHYNILLIFDADRKRGAARARAFDAWLKTTHPSYHELTSGRRKKAWVLHHLGVDAKKLDTLMGR